MGGDMEKGRAIRSGLILTTSAYVLWFLGSSAIMAFLYGGGTLAAAFLLTFAAATFAVLAVVFRRWIEDRVLSPEPRAARAVRTGSYLAYPLVLFLLVITVLPLSLDLGMYPGQEIVLVFRIAVMGEVVLLLLWAVAFALWHRLVSKTISQRETPRGSRPLPR
jgi:hypothetical protein